MVTQSLRWDDNGRSFDNCNTNSLTSDLFHSFQQHVFGKGGYLSGERRQAAADLTERLAEAGAQAAQPRCHVDRGAAEQTKTKPGRWGAAREVWEELA